MVKTDVLGVTSFNNQIIFTISELHYPNQSSQPSTSSIWLSPALKLLTWGVLVVPIILTPIFVLYDLDPLHVFLHCPQLPCPSWISLLLHLIRTLLLLPVATELSKCTTTLLIVGLGVVGACTKVMLELKSRMESPFVLYKMKLIQIYKEFQIWNVYLNTTFAYRAIPPLVFFGAGLMILSSYGTIRMFHSAPGVLYPLMPGSGVLTLLFLVTLLPQGARTFENSVIFLHTVKRCLINKYGRKREKVSKSLRPVGIMCGPFGMIGRKWTLKMAQTIPDYTATLLLTM